MDPNTFKEKGNNFFKEEDYEEAITCYTKALKFSDRSKNDKECAVYLKNRSACKLKMEDYEGALADAIDSLSINPNCPKALFRQVQAEEALEKTEDAAQNMARLIQMDPKNKTFQQTMERLRERVYEKAKDQRDMNKQMENMLSIVDDEAEDVQKRRDAANNILVLAREDQTANSLCAKGGVAKLKDMLEDDDREVQLAAVRGLGCLAKDDTQVRSLLIYRDIGLVNICKALSSPDDDISISASLMFTALLRHISGCFRLTANRRNLETYVTIENPKIINEMMMALCQMLDDKRVAANARDNVVEVIHKNFDRFRGVGWTYDFLRWGLRKMLRAGSYRPEMEALPVTDNTRMHVSHCLQAIYEEMISDGEREEYNDKVKEFMNDMLTDEKLACKIRACVALTTLLEGPIDVGNAILGRPGMIELMMVLAQSEEKLQQLIAVEAIASSATKQTAAKSIINLGMGILKELYKSPHPEIKVRALVGLCKCASTGGQDASQVYMADQSYEQLMKVTRKFLLNPDKDYDQRRWAAEGLACLSLKADIKEELIEDDEVIEALFEVAKHTKRLGQYAVTTILVNLTNTYFNKDDEKELCREELEKVAKFAKHHVPEEHEGDKAKYVEARIQTLLQYQVANVLNVLSTSESKQVQENCSRVYEAITRDKDHRGKVVAAGAVRTLINLGNDGNDACRVRAQQSLSRIAISMDPNIAFSGQRACDAVRPILKLLDYDKTGMETFEGLLALTNLASMGDAVRKRIYAEKGFASVETLMFDQEHPQLRRAATEVINNLVMSEDVAKRFETDITERMKLLILYCEEDDFELVRAAAGALAHLTLHENNCRRIMTVKTWYDTIRTLCMEANLELQSRGVFIVANMMESCEEAAQRICYGDMLEILMAITKLDDPSRVKVGEFAERALEAAREWGIIKPTDAGGSSPEK